MKILLASIYMLPAPGGGGLWSYVLNLKTGLARRGHQADVLAHHPIDKRYYMLHRYRTSPRKEMPDLSLAQVPGLPGTVLSSTESWIRRLEVERIAFAQAARWFGLERYDLIHAQDAIAAEVLRRVKPPEVPLVLTAHGSCTHDLLESGTVAQGTPPWKYAVSLDRDGVAASDVTIVPSRWLAERMHQECGIPAGRMQVVPNGMDTEAFLRRMKVETGLEKPQGVKVILCVARFIREKGHAVLLDALAMLMRDRRDWVCWLVGDGETMGETEQQCMRLGLEKHVRFLGARDDVPALLAQADLFVLPSLEENLPYAVMEAMLAGKPVLATRVGGVRELVEEDVSGILVPAGRSKPLYKKLKALLDNEPIRTRLAGNARLAAQTTGSMERMADRILTMYKDVSG